MQCCCTGMSALCNIYKYNANEDERIMVYIIDKEESGTDSSDRTGILNLLTFMLMPPVHDTVNFVFSS